MATLERLWAGGHAGYVVGGSLREHYKESKRKEKISYEDKSMQYVRTSAQSINVFLLYFIFVFILFLFLVYFRF